jgi:hypothetical protein
MDGILRRSLATGTGMALSMLLGAVAWSQTPPATQESQPPAPQSQPAATPGAQPTQPQRTIQMVPVVAQLDKTLDAKKAKQGDPVTAKLQQGVQIPDAQALPKNTVLEGHVDQVQASDHKSDSTMTVTFDKARLKDGTELAIKATVIAVSEPVNQQPAGGGGTPGQPMPSSAPSGGGSPSGGGGSGSGGGSMGSTPSAPPPQPVSTPNADAGSTQQARNGAVPDVTLKSSIHEHSSATFSSKGKNVHVPDGTQMEVALAVIPAGVTLK